MVNPNVLSLLGIFNSGSAMVSDFAGGASSALSIVGYLLALVPH